MNISNYEKSFISIVLKTNIKDKQREQEREREREREREKEREVVSRQAVDCRMEK